MEDHTHTYPFFEPGVRLRAEISEELKRLKKMEEDKYVRVLGILHRDMYDTLVEMGNPEKKDPMEVLQKMASQLSRNEGITGELEKVTYDKKKNKFNMVFK